MSQLKIIVVGKMKNKALNELCRDYAERLQHFCKTEIVELKDSDPKHEGEKILESLKNFRGKVYAMSEEGKLLTSAQFSKLLERDLNDGASALVIGGAYGLSDEVKARASSLLSLSPMTFTHEFARAILFEQLYRAKNISANTGYHH